MNAGLKLYKYISETYRLQSLFIETEKTGIALILYIVVLKSYIGYCTLRLLTLFKNPIIVRFCKDLYFTK